MRRIVLPAVLALAIVAAVLLLPRGGHVVNASTTASGCPQQPMRRLPAGAIAGATRAALAAIPGARATKAVLARLDRARGGYASAHCDALTRRRSVVVYLHLRSNVPSASLSQAVVLVGRFADGYRVWARLH
jgi:hypothetical protein